VSSSTTVDGLVSGMNTTQVIAQLMQLAAQPQTDLKNQVTKQNGVISAYQSVNAKMNALQTAAETFTAPSPLIPTNPTWQSAKATSSSSAVVATATAGATAGSFTFDVTALAKAQVTTARGFTATDPITTGSGLDLTVGTTTTHINVGTDTPQGVADAINGAKLGVSAAVLNTTQGTILQLTGGTGVANAFSLSGLAYGTTDVTPAADAEITVGNPNTTGYTVTSGTNTFTNVAPNVTLNVSQLATGVSVNVATDADAIADKMQAMIDAANAALSQIKTSTAYNATSKSGGPLMGDYAVRNISSDMLSAVGNGMSGYGDFKKFGVQLTRDGTLTFDRTKFVSAFNADPAGVQGAVADGLAKQLRTVADTATDPLTGSLTTAIQGGNNTVKSLNDQISDWNVRLAAKQAAYQRQFTQLEVALGKMKDQSSWLSGQIAGLGSSSGQ
jgi:flagellar hook-associated protein 2